MSVSTWEVGPCGGVGGGEGIGAGGRLAGEIGWDTDDEGIVLVLLVKDGEPYGEFGWGRSVLDRVIAGGLGRGCRALRGVRRRVRLLFLDAFGPDVYLWWFQGGWKCGDNMVGGLLLLVLLCRSRGGRRARLFGTLGVGLVWVARRRDHSETASVTVALRVTPPPLAITLANHALPRSTPPRSTCPRLTILYVIAKVSQPMGSPSAFIRDI